METFFLSGAYVYFCLTHFEASFYRTLKTSKDKLEHKGFIQVFNFRREVTKQQNLARKMVNAQQI